MHTRGGIPLLTLSDEVECKGMLCMDFASKGAHAPMLCVGGNSPTLSLIDLVAQRVVVTAGPARPLVRGHGQSKGRVMDAGRAVVLDESAG